MLQCPFRFSHTMSEVVPQVIKREIANQFPLRFARSAFQ